MNRLRSGCLEIDYVLMSLQKNDCYQLTQLRPFQEHHANLTLLPNNPLNAVFVGNEIVDNNSRNSIVKISRVPIPHIIIQYSTIYLVSVILVLTYRYQLVR